MKRLNELFDTDNVHSKDLNYYHDKIIYFRVENTLVELNRVSNLFYDCPSNKMKIIGVTGSSGKTVVASMIKDAMAKYCSSGSSVFATKIV